MTHKVALNDVEMANLVKWAAERHHDPELTRPRFEIQEYHTGIGFKIVVRELRSGQEADVTDYQCW